MRNTLRFFVPLILLNVSFLSGFSQTINGIVLDKLENPIPFVSIGILKGNSGTISNLNGTFSLYLKSFQLTDTIRISSVGYKAKDLLIKSILDQSNIKIILEEEIYPINEIVIKSEAKENIVFGRRKKHNSGFAFGKVGQGWELARYFSNSVVTSPKEFQFCISHNDFDSLVFRLQIYSSKDETPNLLISTSPIYVKVESNIGWIKVPLENYHLILDEDFFLSIEAIEGWIPDDKSKLFTSHIILSGQHDKNQFTYVRQNSQGIWQRVDSTLIDYYLVTK